tara:strand:+ start:1438 stop:1683 length:246 start_codon:yes stop_codon:yes gene_type:complete
MGEHYTMWIKINCPFCISARDEFFRQRVNHTINIMDENLDELNELKEKWTHPTVPIIIHQKDGEETLIGGYTDLKEWFDND